MNKRFSILLLSFILILAAVPALAQRDAPQATAPPAAAGDPARGGGYLEPAGQWPYGPAEAIAVAPSRDLVFLSSGGAVLVLDVTDPLNPQLLTDQVKTWGFVEDLFYEPARELLYIAAGQGGLEIWDTSMAATPQRLSATEVIYGGVDIPVEGVTVVDQTAYVAGDWGFLHWLDVSNPAAPQQEGLNGQAVRPTGVTATADNVYAVGNDTGAFFQGDFATFAINADGSLNFTGGRDFGICGSAAIAGDYAYVGCGNWYILDLSAPFLDTVAMLPIDAGNTIISGTMAFVASGASGLHAVDVSTPGSPQEMDRYDSPGGADDLTRIGDYIYLADGSAGLRVVDVSDPAQMAEVSFYETPAWSTAMVVRGDYAYLANSADGLAIIDVSQPLSSTLTGQYNTPGYVYDVALQGDYVYLADVDEGLRIIDVSDPANPTETGFDDTLDAFRVDVNGDYAYVIESIPNQPYWLHVIDVSNPANPVEMGSLELGTLAWRVVVSGDYAYVANNDTGLRIIDISDPANPTQVGVYQVPSVWDVDIQGAYAYVASADWDGGFLVLNISDPANPTLVSSYNPSGWFHPYHVGVAGGFAYVSRNDELHVFDINDPNNPVFLEQVDLPLFGDRIVGVNDLVYVAVREAGVTIFHNSGVNEVATVYLPLALQE